MTSITAATPPSSPVSNAEASPSPPTIAAKASAVYSGVSMPWAMPALAAQLAWAEMTRSILRTNWSRTPNACISIPSAPSSDTDVANSIWAALAARA